ncbi:MAG TPA: hypothetical protein VIL89_04150 [Clostridia bacterium]
MGCKVVLIGGGSYNWTPTLAGDLFSRESLRGSELVLVDINRDAAGIMKKYCEMMTQALGTDWKVSVEELDEALEGAAVVCISISTGGLKAMDLDYHIPEKYGVYHTVGDSVGPGGIARTLRNVPVFLGIARKMERICPDAWLVHVTNPLSQLTRAVCMETSIKCVGLCHNYVGTISMLADYFGVDANEVNALSVGVNHFTWLKNITVNGRPADNELSLKRYVEYFKNRRETLKTNTTDDVIQQELVGENMDYYFNFFLFERFGYFPVGTSNHVAENLPYYCNNKEVMKKYHIRRKGVLPRRQILSDKKADEIHGIVSGKRPLPEIEPSNEAFSLIVESLYTGKSSRCIAAMPNKGQITNLPGDVIVETWVHVNGSGIFPVMSGEIPVYLTGYMQTVIDEQEAAVKAAITGDRNLVVRAMHISPQMLDKEASEQLTDELLNAHREYLPQFFPKT